MPPDLGLDAVTLNRKRQVEYLTILKPNYDNGLQPNHETVGMDERFQLGCESSERGRAPVVQGFAVPL